MTETKSLTEINWAGNFHYAFNHVLHPTTITQAQAMVAATGKLTVIGSRHSFNSIADGPIALSVGALPSDVLVSNNKTTVVVPAGMTYAALARALHRHGLALQNLASLPHISLAGAIATATHGSGDTNGNLASAVAALRFITADGSLLDVDRDHPDFNGYVVHLGALGVLTHVTLDVVPEFEVSQRVYDDLSWQSFLQNLDDVFAAGYSVSVFTRWQDAAGQVWVKQRAELDNRPEDLFGALAAQEQRHPILGLDPENCTQQLGVPGLWSDRLPHFRPGFQPSNGDELQSEYHIPRIHGVAAIESLLSIREQFQHLVQDGEFRTTCNDHLWMSPQYDLDTLSLHFTWSQDPEGVSDALKHVEAALAPYGARPHWGKVFLPGQEPTADLYPRHADFRKLVAQMDPTAKFSNSWLRTNITGT